MLSLGLDIRKLGTSDLTYRRLAAVLRSLPPSSAFVRSAGGPSAAWSTAEHLLAAAVDLLAVANWQRHGKGSPPKPLPRPGQPRRAPKSYSIEEARKRFGVRK